MNTITASKDSTNFGQGYVMDPEHRTAHETDGYRCLECNEGWREGAPAPLFTEADVIFSYT